MQYHKFGRKKKTRERERERKKKGWRKLHQISLNGPKVVRGGSHPSGFSCGRIAHGW
jgi:ribosomal protein L32E